jgi:hypothetical protein
VIEQNNETVLQKIMAERLLVSFNGSSCASLTLNYHSPRNEPPGETHMYFSLLSEQKANW